jgi:hypothetical protein
MKRFFLALLAVILLANFASAQLPEHSLGIRFGSVYGIGTEVSYQHGLNSHNRVELNLGFSSDYEYINDFRHDYNSWAITGLYHWVKPIGNGLNWYYGPGGKLGVWSNNLVYGSRYENGIFLAADGDVGIEYCFPSGIQLSLDARPELGLINHGSGFNLGLAVRYQFK